MTNTHTHTHIVYPSVQTHTVSLCLCELVIVHHNPIFNGWAVFSRRCKTASAWCVFEHVWVHVSAHGWRFFFCGLLLLHTWPLFRFDLDLQLFSETQIKEEAGEESSLWWVCTAGSLPLRLHTPSNFAGWSWRRWVRGGEEGSVGTVGCIWQIWQIDTGGLPDCLMAAPTSLVVRFALKGSDFLHIPAEIQVT